MVISRVQVASNGKLYGTTQSSGLPRVFEVDPVSLRHRVIGHVCRHQPPNSFCYYLMLDLPWIYVAVGETVWELAAINVDTGTSKVLAERPDRGFIHFARHKQGVVAKLVSDNKGPAQKDDRVWCVDGKTYPFEASAASLPFTARDVRAPAATLPGAPEVDLTALDPASNGVGRVRWRPHGSTGARIERTFKL